MRTDNLLYMANQIAHFFEPYPEADAVAGVRDHLLKFWDPRMRTQLVDLLRTTPEGAHALVLKAADGLPAPVSP